MGLLIIKSNTSNGLHEQSTYSNYDSVHVRVNQWKNHPNIKSVKVSKNGMDVRAEWHNGDKRSIIYEPSKGEGFLAATSLPEKNKIVQE